MANSVSVCEHLRFFAESACDIKKVNLSYEKTDSTASDVEYGVAAVPANTTQSIGNGTLFGRIITGTKLMLITDNPCSLAVTFSGIALPQTIPLQDILVINGSITDITVTTTTLPASIQVAVAGTI